MALLIFLLICGIAGIVFGILMLKNEPDDNYWFTPIIVGVLVIGVSIPLITYETIPHNTFKTKEIPQIDTVVIYTSVNKQFDTTYIYTFKDE